MQTIPRNTPYGSRSSWLLSLPLLIPIAALVLLHQQNQTLRAHITPYTVTFFTVAMLGFVFALLVAEKRPHLINWQLIWGVAIVARLMLLFTTPTLSDDVYRYLWDGHIANSGVSPYALPIDSADLDPYAVPVRDLANNTWMASPYMPAAQWVFRALNGMVGTSPLSLQIIMVVFDLGAAFFIAKLLAAAGHPSNRIMLYLWNPLVIVEVAHSAHVDAWMVLLMLAGVWFAFKPVPSARDSLTDSMPAVDLHHQASSPYNWLFSPILMALATLTKILPVLILPVLFWRWSWRQRILYGLLSLGLLVPAGLRAGWGLTGPLDGTGLFGALRIYNGLWKFNSGIFFWVTRWLNHGDGYTPSPADSQFKTITLVIVVIMLLTVWWLAYQRRDLKHSLRLMSIPLACYLLLTPTVHPWYALILLVFVPFLPPTIDENKNYWLITVPWIYLSGGLIFSYLTYLDPNDFRELAWVRNLEWIPTLTLLALGLIVLSGQLLSTED